MKVMTAAVWLALAFLVLATAGGATAALRRGRAAWRSLGELNRAASAATTASAAAASRVEQRVVSPNGGSERLEQARARLRRSLAELHVLGAALAGVTRVLSVARRAVPRK